MQEAEHINGAAMQRTVRIINPAGLHMRPSAAFVETANRFQSTVTVTHGEQVANGRSLWDLLMLGAQAGTELTLEVNGPDAAEALEALVNVLNTVPEDV